MVSREWENYPIHYYFHNHPIPLFPRRCASEFHSGWKIQMVGWGMISLLLWTTFTSRLGVKIVHDTVDDDWDSLFSSPDPYSSDSRFLFGYGRFLLSNPNSDFSASNSQRYCARITMQEILHRDIKSGPGPQAVQPGCVWRTSKWCQKTQPKNIRFFSGL